MTQDNSERWFKVQPSRKYFEEVNVGDKFTTLSRTVTETDIINFCGISGDYGPWHSDMEFAKKSGYQGIIAHWTLTLTIAWGLYARAGVLQAISTLGVNSLSLKGPVKPGDTIRLEGEIINKKETKRADRGVVTLHNEVKNQRDDTVMEFEAALLTWRE